MRDERVSQGILNRILRGEFVGRTPWGYIRNAAGDLEIDDDAAEHIIKIYEWYFHRGKDYHEIARTLNNQSIRRNGYPFYPNNIKRILESPVYKGKLRYKKQIYEGKHQAIIDEEYKMAGDYDKYSESDDVNSFTDDDGSHNTE